MYGTCCLYGGGHYHFDAGKFILRGLERVGPEYLYFFGPWKWQIGKRVAIWAQKSCNNRYIGNFMYMSLAANVPVVYMALNIIIFMGGQIHLEAIESGDPWNIDFFGSKMETREA